MGKITLSVRLMDDEFEHDVEFNDEDSRGNGRASCKTRTFSKKC